MILPALDAGTAEALFARMFDGAMGEAEIAATLVALAERGETADEIAGAARAMRARMIPIAAPEGAIVERVYRYARWQGGRSAVWTARRRGVGAGEGSSGLNFDILDPS